MDLEGLFPSTSDFADFALEELLLFMNAFFVTVPVGLTSKCLIAVRASIVVDLLVNSVDMSSQTMVVNKLQLANVAAKLQDLEVNTVDVAHQLDGKLEGHVASVTRMVASERMDLQNVGPCHMISSESLVADVALLAASFLLNMGLKIFLANKLLFADGAHQLTFTFGVFLLSLGRSLCQWDILFRVC